MWVSGCRSLHNHWREAGKRDETRASHTAPQNISPHVKSPRPKSLPGERSLRPKGQELGLSHRQARAEPRFDVLACLRPCGFGPWPKGPSRASSRVSYGSDSQPTSWNRGVIRDTRLCLVLPEEQRSVRKGMCLALF